MALFASERKLNTVSHHLRHRLEMSGRGLVEMDFRLAQWPLASILANQKGKLGFDGFEFSQKLFSTPTWKGPNYEPKWHREGFPLVSVIATFSFCFETIVQPR